MTVYHETAACFSDLNGEEVLKMAALASNPANKDDAIDRATYQAYARMAGFGTRTTHAPRAHLSTLCKIFIFALTRRALLACCIGTWAGKDVDEASKDLLKGYTLIKYYGFNPTIKRTVADYIDKKTGKKLRVAKGIISKILKTTEGTYRLAYHLPPSLPPLPITSHSFFFRSLSLSRFCC